MASYMYHDLETPGSVHVPHDLEYADQVARKGASGLPDRQLNKLALQTDDGSLWRLKTTGPEWVPVSPPEPELTDIGKAIGIVGDGDGGLKLAPIAAGGTLQTGYDFGGAGAGREITAANGALKVTVPDNSNNACLELVQNDVTNPVPAISLSGTGLYPGAVVGGDINVELLSVGTADSDRFAGVRAYNYASGRDAYVQITAEATGGAGASGYLQLNATGASQTEQGEVSIGAYPTKSQATFIGHQGVDNDIQIGSLVDGIVADLNIYSYPSIDIFSAGGELNLKDQYLATAVQLSETGETGLDTTAQSLVGGINELKTDLDAIVDATFDDIYQNESGDHSVLVDDGDVIWNLGSSYGMHFDNGSDYLRLDNSGTNQLDLSAELYDVVLNNSHGAVLSLLMPFDQASPIMTMTRPDGGTAPVALQPLLKLINNNVKLSYGAPMLEIQNNDSSFTQHSIVLTGAGRTIMGYSDAAALYANAVLGSVSLDSYNVITKVVALGLSTGLGLTQIDASHKIQIGCNPGVTEYSGLADIEMATQGSGRNFTVGADSDGVLSSFSCYVDGDILFKPRNANSLYLGSVTATGGLELRNSPSGSGIQVATGSTQKVGFFGATPVVQLAKASYNNWAALSDVVDALVAIGLFDAA